MQHSTNKNLVMPRVSSPTKVQTKNPRESEPFGCLGVPRARRWQFPRVLECKPTRCRFGVWAGRNREVFRAAIPIRIADQDGRQLKTITL
ncbi:MAG: hypothetical protein HC933_15330 [Pleurocapsa sp. SU_196_0]|nr:hypothetical protein [Pleurocapsa sp. SU_196_0]